MDYVAGERPADSYIEQLDAAVKRAKQNRKWKREYMTLYMRDLENIEIGKEQGIKIFIETCKDLGEDKQATISRIFLKYSFSREDAEKYVAKYWGM